MNRFQLKLMYAAILHSNDLNKETIDIYITYFLTLRKYKYSRMSTLKNSLSTKQLRVCKVLLMHINKIQNKSTVMDIFVKGLK